MRLNLCYNLARINGVRLSTIAIADFKDSFEKSKSIYMEGLRPCGNPRRGAVLEQAGKTFSAALRRSKPYPDTSLWLLSRIWSIPSLSLSVSSPST